MSFCNPKQPARLSFVCWSGAFGLSKPKVCRGEIVVASFGRGADTATELRRYHVGSWFHPSPSNGRSFHCQFVVSGTAHCYQHYGSYTTDRSYSPIPLRSSASVTD